MNRVDIRNRARAITELTSDDVSDSIIDMYARDGYERIINMERRWPSFETSTTFTASANDDEYTLASISDLREITSIVDASTGYRLDLIGYEQGEDVWANAGTGRPQHWSLWAQSVKLWPTPDTTYTYRVRGYRKPTEWWNFDGVEVDADERLHAAIVYYVLSRLYQLQEDIEMSNFYAATFAESARSAHADIMRTPSQRPLVLNQGVPFGPSSYARYVV